MTNQKEPVGLIDTPEKKGEVIKFLRKGPLSKEYIDAFCQVMEEWEDPATMTFDAVRIAANSAMDSSIDESEEDPDNPNRIMPTDIYFFGAAVGIMGLIILYIISQGW